MITQTIAVPNLTGRDRDAMHSLLRHHFDGVTRGGFETDLAEKNWAVLVRDRDGLVGFSSYLYKPTRWRGETIWAVTSGDTIVAPRAWRSTALSQAWIRSVWQTHGPNRAQRLFWLLIVSGFRTYRFLPTFYRSFYPRHDQPTPAGTRTLMDRLARERYGQQYHPGDGVVRLTRPQRLRGSLRGIPAGRHNNPHVAFFENANPGHDAGDELVCLTELAPENLTRAGARMAGVGQHTNAEAAVA